VPQPPKILSLFRYDIPIADEPHDHSEALLPRAVYPLMALAALTSLVVATATVFFRALSPDVLTEVARTLNHVLRLTFRNHNPRIYR
jgi:hypothetical protein